MKSSLLRLALSCLLLGPGSGLMQAPVFAAECDKWLQQSADDFHAGKRTEAETGFGNAAFDGCEAPMVKLAMASAKGEAGLTHDVLKGGAYSGNLALQKNYVYFLLAKQQEASSGGPPMPEPLEEIHAFATILAGRGEGWAGNYVATLDKLMPPSASYVNQVYLQKVQAKIALYQSERANPAS